MPSERSLSLNREQITRDMSDSMLSAAQSVGMTIARERERRVNEAILRSICGGDPVKETPVPTMQCKNCDKIVRKDVPDEDIAKQICPECLFIGTMEKLPRPAKARKPGRIRCDSSGGFVAEYV